MRDEYFHIKNAYLRAAERKEENKYVLVIETELSLPQPGQASPELDTLLTEIGDFKKKNPFLFEEIDSVEIRHLSPWHMPAPKDRLVDLTGALASQGIKPPEPLMTS